jgi:hypothetical protein
VDDRWRLYPGGFIEAYYEAFGGYPPERVRKQVDTYLLQIAESIWLKIEDLGIQTPTPRKRGRRER